MENKMLILVIQAMAVYLLVLCAHSLRHRHGPIHFYALLGGITAIMSWVTDAGVAVEFAGITFLVGSTVFYTSLLLGVFVVYVFDGIRATRITITLVAGISVMVPLVAAALHLQMPSTATGAIPLPSLRINSASVATTLIDLVFLAIAWEYLGKPALKIKLWLRTFLTLLGVMWLDVILFTTGAYFGSPAYLGIMLGTLVSRFIIAIFALPFLYGYLQWQSSKKGQPIHNRPVLAILKQVAEIKNQLTEAQMEIKRRIKAENDRDNVIKKLRKALSEIKTLRGFLPICSFCNQIRDDQGAWHQMECYIRDHSEAVFSHGVCPDCAQVHYPDSNDDDP